ncbi:MAG: MopE-related protein [Myxococcota bacterium]
MESRVGEWCWSHRWLAVATALPLAGPAWADRCDDADHDTVCDRAEDVDDDGNLDDDDSDGDGTPDYLDDDDDGDGVRTREEDVDRDGDASNDETGLEDDGVPDYLDPSVPTDRDHDGYVSTAYGGDDCDDTRLGVNPGVDHDPLYDGEDWDCDDPDLVLDFDADRDGHLQEKEADDGDDCNDNDPDIHPGVEEEYGDGVDQDCDGFTDPASAVEPIGGCSCAGSGVGPGSAGFGSSAGAWVALGLAVRRRR